MIPVKEMTRAEACAFIQSHLMAKGIHVVLSGGSCVSIYCEEKYVSNDLDLINIYSVHRRLIREAMKEIGFLEQGRHFRHPESAFLIEFPPGPLTIGIEPMKDIDEIHLSTGTLRMISPTDCVKDRLAAYYHWGDQQCLMQAKLVASAHRIDLDDVKNWSISEGKLVEFEKIQPYLAREES